MIRLIPALAPAPSGPELTATDVPDDFVLRKLSTTQRVELLAGLSRTLRRIPGGATLTALRRVFDETNALALEQALDTLARHGTLGLVVEAVGLEWLLQLGRQRAVAVSDVLATTDTVSRRGLTRSESQRIRENFANTLDPDTVRFCFTTGVQSMGAGAMVVGNTIHVDPTDPRWAIKPGTTLPEDPHDEAWDSYNGVILAHEPSHIFSYQHQGSRYAINSVVDQLNALRTGDRSGAYAYKPDRPHFLDYGEEQRAMLVQDFIAAVRGKATGETTSLTLYGGSLRVDDVIHTLTRYIEQMRAMGPGVAEPVGRQPEWIVCACVRPFEQDGVAGFLGAQGSALVAAAGRASTDALVDGLAHRDGGKVALGAAGVGAAVAASLIPREQNDYGATSGGSAILDQAGIPRGVEVGGDGLSAGVKAGWDAPAAGHAPGMKDPRLEWSTGVHRDVGSGVRVDADAAATIGFSGTVQQLKGTVKVSGDDTSLELGATHTPAAKPHGAARTWAHLEFVTEPVTVDVSGAVVTRDGVVTSADVNSRVEAGRVQVTTGVQLQRSPGAARDAPLQLDSASVEVSAQLAPGLTGSVGTTLVPGGIDAVSARVAAVGDAGALTVSAEGTKLQSTPTVGVAVTATEKKTGVSVSAHASVTPSTSAVEAGVGLSVPLPEPKK